VNVYGNVVSNGYIQATQYYGDGGTLSNISTFTQPLANLVVSNSVTTNNLYASNNLYVANNFQVDNTFFANTTIVDMNFNTLTITYVNTSNLVTSNIIGSTGNVNVYGNVVVNSGSVGLGIASPVYQLDISTDGARKLTTTTWITGSDSRIKTDIQSANLQMCYDTVKSVDLKYFRWNFPEGIVPDDRHSLGFIAQEVKEVFPNAVSESNSYGYSDFLNLNTDQILKAMYGALKQTMKKVEELQAIVTTNASSL
jgi:hypothetical protein